MNLLVSQYAERNPKRRLEYLDCIERNARVKEIRRILALMEDESLRLFEHHPLSVDAGAKVLSVALFCRAKFAHFLVLANATFHGQVCIVANADIYFDETLEALANFDLQGKFICLSRQDSLWRDSQDAWIFQAPIPVFGEDIELGRMACDNRIAYEAQQRGLELLNPSLTIRAHHNHASKIRNYDPMQRASGGQAYIEPHELGKPPPPARPMPKLGFTLVNGWPPRPGDARLRTYPEGFNPSIHPGNRILPNSSRRK